MRKTLLYHVKNHLKYHNIKNVLTEPRDPLPTYLYTYLTYQLLSSYLLTSHPTTIHPTKPNLILYNSTQTRSIHPSIPSPVHPSIHALTLVLTGGDLFFLALWIVMEAWMTVRRTRATTTPTMIQCLLTWRNLGRGDEEAEWMGEVGDGVRIKMSYEWAIQLWADEIEEERYYNGWRGSREYSNIFLIHRIQ